MGEHAVGLDFTLHNRKQNAIEWLIGHETRFSSARVEASLRSALRIETRLSVATTSRCVGAANMAVGLAPRRWVSTPGLCLRSARARRSTSSSISLSPDSFVAPDLTALCEDILDGNVKQMVLQHEPYRLLWCITEDGKLRSLTYERTQDVVAWATHELGGGNAKVLSIAVIPHPDGDQDQLWMVVERDQLWPHGSRSAQIEYLARPREPTTARKDAQFLDLRSDAVIPDRLAV